MKHFGTAIACLGLVALLAGCSTTRVAQEKSVTVGQVKLAFGGSFVTGQNDLTITATGTRSCVVRSHRTRQPST